MQEFVDRFRYNANRAALVQSRIKSMNKEVIIEDAENDDTDGFNFQFADAGDLGRNVIVWGTRLHFTQKGSMIGQLNN
jgi:ATPase subunit of ABC transporter with duplicated ATPase domains